MLGGGGQGNGGGLFINRICYSIWRGYHHSAIPWYDLAKGEISATDQNEYYNLGSELEGIMEISMNNLFDIESDQMLKNALGKNSNLLDEQIVERINIIGSRMGIGYAGGLQGKILMDS